MLEGAKHTSFTYSKYFLMVTEMAVATLNLCFKKNQKRSKHCTYGLGALGLFYRFNKATMRIVVIGSSGILNCIIPLSVFSAVS